MIQFRLWFLALPRITRFILVLYCSAFASCFVVLWRIPITAGFLESQLVLGASWWRAPWQLITYSLLHSASFGGLIHLAFGLFWLYWIGREVEELRGSAIMLSLWSFSVVVGGLMAVLVAPTIGFETPAFAGLWGGVLGTMVAVCLWVPDKRIWLFVLGPIRLWYIVAALLVLELVRPASGLISVGGAASAWLFVWLDRRGVDMKYWADYLLKATAKLRAYLRAPETDSKPQPNGHKVHSSTNVDTDELDRILDKINAEGMEALTRSERRVLDKASRQ